MVFLIEFTSSRSNLRIPIQTVAQLSYNSLLKIYCNLQLLQILNKALHCNSTLRSFLNYVRGKH